MKAVIKKNIAAYVLGAALLTLTPFVASAATLFVAPASANVTVGDTLTVAVEVNSGGVAINNAEGSFTFPSALFDLVSINKDASLFSLWINAPSYDGADTVSFNGGLPSPGYQGGSGQLFTVTLRAKAAGTATLALTNGAVRANDGLGTDVMSAENGGAVSIAAKTAPASAPSTTASAPASGALAISSPTDPSQDAWYSSPQATLEWGVPQGADEVEAVLSQTPGAAPVVAYAPPIAQKTLTDIADGVWYFNLRAHSAGGWGPVSSYKLQIDTAPPALSDVSIQYDDASRSLLIGATATDTLSGVAKFAVVVDGSEVATIAPADLDQQTHSVPLFVPAGQHTAVLRAYDSAGNHTDSAPVEFISTTPPSSLDALITWARSLNAASLLVIAALVLSCISVLINLVVLRRVHRIEQKITNLHDK